MKNQEIDVRLRWSQLRRKNRLNCSYVLIMLAKKKLILNENAILFLTLSKWGSSWIWYLENLMLVFLSCSLKKKNVHRRRAYFSHSHKFYLSFLSCALISPLKPKADALLVPSKSWRLPVHYANVLKSLHDDSHYLAKRTSPSPPVLFMYTLTFRRELSLTSSLPFLYLCQNKIFYTHE